MREKANYGGQHTRHELEARVLRAMQTRFFEPGRFDEFCRGFTEEMNRLRRDYRTKLAALPREIAGIDRRSKEILELLLQGFRDEAWKEELRRLEERRTELKASVANPEKEPVLPALHPQMAQVFRQKTMQLVSALEHEDAELREAARESLRGFIDHIVIPPKDGLLQVVGEFRRNADSGCGSDGLSGCRYSWLRGGDLNPRPLGYEPNELPDCSTPRYRKRFIVADKSLCNNTGR